MDDTGPRGSESQMEGIHEQAAVLALVSRVDIEWYRLASLIEEAGSALRILRRDWTGFESFEFIEKEEAERLAARVTEDDLAKYEALIEELNDGGAKLLTVVDEGYPLNLRLVYNRPPFLWVRGTLEESDNHAVAVVGTRTATSKGLSQARALATGLAEHGVTVLSGLALGVDAAAHEAALAAGGRTIAVLGNGIRRPIYPEANRHLAERIIDKGALISQFWPDHPPTRTSFPMRNVVSSGMAIGTVVVEAGKTSGARMQARLAIEHGKRLFLVKSLVLQEEWAQRYAQKAATTVVDNVDDILELLVNMARPPGQLSLA